jgi:hypothetical protein
MGRPDGSAISRLTWHVWPRRGAGELEDKPVKARVVGGADGNQPRGYRCRGGARRRRQLRGASGSQDGAAIAKAKGTQPLTVCEIEIGIDASLSF